MDNTRAAAREWDGKRFPVQYADARSGHAGPRLAATEEQRQTAISEPNDELYHVREDHLQASDLAGERPDVLHSLKETLSRAMSDLDAPEEQWDRLGLPRGGSTR